jgi:hypothetical protein
VVKIRSNFNKHFQSGQQTIKICLDIEIADKEEQKHNNTICEESAMIFVGKTSSRTQQRVFYFTYARIS